MRHPQKSKRRQLYPLYCVPTTPKWYFGKQYRPRWMLHNASIHQGLHCLLRQYRSSEKEIQHVFEIITMIFNIYNGPPWLLFIACSLLENSIDLKRVKAVKVPVTLKNNRLTLFILYTVNQVLWQTVKTHIRVCPVCEDKTIFRDRNPSTP